MNTIKNLLLVAGITITNRRLPVPAFGQTPIGFQKQNMGDRIRASIDIQMGTRVSSRTDRRSARSIFLLLRRSAFIKVANSEV